MEYKLNLCANLAPSRLGGEALAPWLPPRHFTW
jgi:hypothetical protein